MFFVAAPARVTDRFESIFNLKDPTNRDRLAMMREGAHMMKDHPLLGIGPNMVQPLYAKYRDSDAVNGKNPHVQTAPLQIRAERALPAIAARLWYVYELLRALRWVLSTRRHKVVA